MSKKIILFTLQTFSTTGGIQKMTRTIGHSLHQIAVNNNWVFKLLSAYDADRDLMPEYLPKEEFKGYHVNRVGFTMRAIKEARTSDIVILSHINLSVVGLAIKRINPKCKVWLIAHGIEVWRPLTYWQRSLLKKCDKVLCVSCFTRQQICTLHKTDLEKCTVLNNAIDPFMVLPSTFAKPNHLLEKYNLKSTDPVIFTLTRLAATEQYKGHDQVISVLNKLKEKFPGIKYILSGKYDVDEEVRIKELIKAHHVEEDVIMTGFIAESELPDHFLLADVFVLPSKKEGFGIVFIEALACGLPVICGNADGSTDAIRNGELGQAIAVDDLAQLEDAIVGNLETPLTVEKRSHLQQKCLQYFNEQDYTKSLQQILTS